MQAIIQQAEQTINQLTDQYNNIRLSMTQIRKFLAAVNAINNKVLAHQSQTGEGKDLEILPPDLVNEIRYLEVKLLYQCGRERNVKDFADKGKLFERIRGIGNSRKKYDEFAKFMEAVVAFHKFKGGRD